MSILYKLNFLPSHRTLPRRFAIVFLACVMAIPGLPTPAVAQDDEEVDESCRLETSLTPEQVFDEVTYSYHPQFPTVGIRFRLKSNHALVRENYSCSKDKIVLVRTASINDCEYFNSQVGSMEVAFCSPNVGMLVVIKVKFSENYNVNGNVIVPRRLTFNFIIPHHPNF